MSITGYVGMVNIKLLSPQFIPPPEIFAATPATFIIRLTNNKRHIPSFLLKLESSSGAKSIIPFIANQQTVDTDISLIFSDRGWQKLPALTISSPFPVNFFTRFWKFELNESVLVFPHLLPLHSTDSLATYNRGGQHQQTFRGIDGELEKIASYSGREPLKAIHWKHSARRDELLVKEFGALGAPPFIIKLNEIPGLDEDEQVSHAAWMINRYSMERPVGLLVGEKSIAPAIGKKQRYLLLKELALYGSN